VRHPRLKHATRTEAAELSRPWRALAGPSYAATPGFGAWGAACAVWVALLVGGSAVAGEAPSEEPASAAPATVSDETGGSPAEPAPTSVAPLEPGPDAATEPSADPADLSAAPLAIPEPLATPPAALPAEPSPSAPRFGARRPAPPGTPEAFLDARPTPPYARWPLPDGPSFPDERACAAEFARQAPGAMGRTIRRFDAVYRRCEPVADGWAYREDHAPVTLDPILEPLWLVVPSAVWLSDYLRYRDSVGRAAQRWDLSGDDPSLRQPTFRPPQVAGAAWRPVSDVLRAGAIGASWLPVFTSRGNAKATDALIMAEVHVVAAGITGSINLRRPEPIPLADADLRQLSAPALWDTRGELEDDVAYQSGVSAHTATVAAAGFGLATLSALHHPDASWGRRIVPYVFAAGFTALEGTARVLSLRADPGDALAGGLVGAASGLMVPLSHAAIARVIDPERIQRQQRARAAKASQVSVAPYIQPTGVGVTGVW
jgi:hypothetical protein